MNHLPLLACTCCVTTLGIGCFHTDTSSNSEEWSLEEPVAPDDPNPAAESDAMIIQHASEERTYLLGGTPACYLRSALSTHFIGLGADTYALREQQVDDPEFPCSALPNSEIARIRNALPDLDNYLIYLRFPLASPTWHELDYSYDQTLNRRVWVLFNDDRVTLQARVSDATLVLGLYASQQSGCPTMGREERTELRRPWTLVDVVITSPEKEHWFSLGQLQIPDTPEFLSQSSVSQVTNAPLFQYSKLCLEPQQVDHIHDVELLDRVWPLEQ